MGKFKIKRRFPNSFSGFEETEHYISNIEELKEIDWIKNSLNKSYFYSLGIGNTNNDDTKFLMIFNYFDEKYNGCKQWWAIGYIIGDLNNELNLVDSKNLMGSHKDNCPQKILQHNDCNCGFK